MRMFPPSNMIPTAILEQDYRNFHLNEDFIVDSHILKNNFDNSNDMLDSLNAEYFCSDIEFDSSRFELLGMSKLFKLHDIALHCNKLIEQHHIVSKKLLLIILQNQFKCKVELENILKIKKNLVSLITVCKNCRVYLNLATVEFTASSLQILHYCRKRKMLKNLLSILYNIKNLYGTKDKLQQFLNEENYSTVISLISECHKAAETYRQYYCVVALSNNMNEILETVEQNLDISLSKVCIAFNADNYASIYTAYHFLSKSETAIDQLHMHFTAAVHKTAVNSVYKYAVDITKEQYNDLCTSMPLSNFFSSLMDLCGNLLKILKSYYLIYKWHVDYKISENKSNDHVIVNYRKNYILEKLQSGIIKTFYDIENKILIYFDGCDLGFLKYEEFIKILSVMDRMFKIGNVLCNRNMTKLYECVKKKFLNYFTFYHASRLDELRIFLENDGWELCPIKTKFNYTQMIEFKTLDFLLNLCGSKESIDKQISDVNIFKENNLGENFFDNVMYPFDVNFFESTEEDILKRTQQNQLKDLSDDSDDDEIPEELKHDYVDDRIDDTALIQIKKHTGPILTNTTLSVLRICGKYLQIIPIFKEVTKIVIQYLTQLFGLYFYAVYQFFASDFITSDYGAIHTTNIKRIISHIKEKLIQGSDKSIDDGQYHKVRQPQLLSLNLNDPNKLFCLTERIVATESLIFLRHQYECFQLHFNTVLSTDDDSVIQFYRQIISSATSLRKPVYMAAISKTFDVSNILSLMSKVNWELKDVVSQHSDYVDSLIQEMHSFGTKFANIQKQVPLCKEAYESIWESVANIISHALVEGFSNAKKCSNGGRALMQLDFTQFVSKFEKISQLRPMPYQEHVASYIKAYYLPESSIELWIQKHSEYSSKQLLGLLSCMFQNRKVKQRLISLIDDNRLNR